jgi:oligoribonuclease NrnB/cAMP/cGMP phosphodiesterase (DHH superfamily)
LNPGKISAMEEDIFMEMNEKDLVDIDLDKIEEVLNKKDLKSIPDDQLRKVHKVFFMLKEKTGGKKHLKQDNSKLQEIIDNLKLVDIEIGNGTFT